MQKSQQFLSRGVPRIEAEQPIPTRDPRDQDARLLPSVAGPLNLNQMSGKGPRKLTGRRLLEEKDGQKDFSFHLAPKELASWASHDYIIERFCSDIITFLYLVF